MKKRTSREGEDGGMRETCFGKVLVRLTQTMMKRRVDRQKTKQIWFDVYPLMGRVQKKEFGEIDQYQIHRRGRHLRRPRPRNLHPS